MTVTPPNGAAFGGDVYHHRVPFLVCPDCGRQISDVAPSCPGCGRPGYRSPIATAPVPFGHQNLTKRQIVAGSGIGAIVLVVVIAAMCAPSSAAPGAAEPAPMAAPTIVTVGTVGTLRGLGGTAIVMLFEDRAGVEAVVKASVAHDDIGWRQVVQAKAIVVPAGAKALKLDWSFASSGAQVRVVDGPKAGIAGWTFGECLVP